MNIRRFMARMGAALIVTFSTQATADISLTYQSQANPDYRSTILVSANHIRFENPMAPEFYMLFNVERQFMTLVDSEKRSYSILDRETLESLSEQIEVTRQAIMAELKAGMKVAGEEEKAQMAMILEQIQQLAEAPPKQMVSYQPMDQNDEVNGFACRMIEAQVNDETQARLCVADADVVGVPEEAMSTLESFHNFSGSVHQQLNPGDATELLFVMNSKQQLPVSIKRLYPESAADEYRLTQVQTLNVPASAFQVPDDFEAKDIEDAFIVE